MELEFIMELPHQSCLPQYFFVVVVWMRQRDKPGQRVLPTISPTRTKSLVPAVADGQCTLRKLRTKNTTEFSVL